jgi:hypothetical protein
MRLTSTCCFWYYESRLACGPVFGVNYSRGDLETGLRRAAVYELGGYDSDADESEEIEQKILEVFYELEQRARAAQEAYPFAVNYDGVIKLRSDKWQDFPVYTFCLCVSYFPLRDINTAPELFENISCLAAKGYLQGDVVKFGAPRRELPSPFPEAVTELCRRMGEGIEYKEEQPSLDRQDDTLDLVAWKDFPDRQTSKIIMFGQCGAGRNWDTKLRELQPRNFWGQWIKESCVSPEPIRSFFTPYRIDEVRWSFYARNAGILFDRCRIAFWASKEGKTYDPIINWADGFLGGFML